MASTYEKIATTTLGSAASTITFSSISGSYTDLVLVSDNIGDGLNAIYVYFNSTTGTTNYSYTQLSGNGSTASSSRVSNTDSIPCGITDTTRNNFIVNIMNYSNTTTFKTVINRGNTPSFAVRAFVGLWRSTNAITSVSITSGGAVFQSTSMFTLYGIKAA